MVISLVPFAGSIIAILLQWWMGCAYMLAYQSYKRGESLTFKSFWKFKGEFWAGLGAMILGGIVACFGMFPSIFFGIYLRITYSMIICVATDPALQHLSATEIMGTSRKIFHYFGWKLFGFQILSSLIVLLGFLCLGFGVFASIPVIMYAQADIYYRHRFRLIGEDVTHDEHREPLMTEVATQQ